MSALPRETYTGPVLAGSRWRQRGLNGHSQYLVTVLRHAGRSVQLVIEGTPGGAPRASKSRRDVGKKYNVPIDQFRNSYVLVAQPKGYVEPTPLQAALDKALAEVEVAKQPTAWPTPPPAPGAVTPATVLLIDGPPTAEEMDENLAVLQQNWKEQEQMLATPPALETPPLEAPPAPPAPTPAVEPDDPDAAFAVAGKAILNRLSLQIEGLRREQDEYQAIVDDLDKRIAALQAREERIGVAILDAIEAVEKEAPAEPEPPHRVDRSVARENPAAQESGDSVTAGLSESAESGPTAPPEGREPGGRRLGQREFLVKLLRAKKAAGVPMVTVAELATAYAEEFELPVQRASMNVSSIMVDQMKRATTADWPAMARVEKGIYRFS